MHELLQRRDSDKGLVGSRGDEAGVGPAHVSVVAIKPTPKMPAESNLAPADQDHGEAQNGEQMKEVETAGQMVDAKGGEVQDEHGYNVGDAEGAVPSSGFGREENNAAKY